MSPPDQPDNPMPEKIVMNGRGEQIDLEDFKKRVADEYRMLQEKIDKFGAFRFTIKGWSITAVIAASAASSAANRLSTVITISSGLSVMLVFFFVMELEQVKLSRLFGDRSRRLENAFVRIDRKGRDAAKLPFPVPYTVNEIASASRGQRVLHAGRLSQTEAPRPFLKRLSDRWRLWRRSHFWFYFVLFFLAFAPLIPRYDEIGAWINKWSIEKSSVRAPSTAPKGAVK